MAEALIIAIIISLGAYTYKVGKEVGGYLSFWHNILSTGPSRQVTIDLYIATTILCIIMIFDAIEVGISMVWVTFYIIIAIAMASFGPLLYLLHRIIVT